MIILIDADDVLEDLSPKWVAWLNARYGLNAPYETHTDWNMEHVFPTLSREQVYDVEMNEEFYATLEPLPGAVSCVRRLVEEGHSVYVVTTTPYQIVRAKMEQVIFRYFPFLSWKNVILTSNKHLIQGDVLIDDGVHNLLGGSYRKILMTGPYNKDFDAEGAGMIRVHNWDEIDAALRSMMEEAPTAGGDEMADGTAKAGDEPAAAAQVEASETAKAAGAPTAKESAAPALICAGAALVDSMIKGFDPNPVSATGFRAESGVLRVGGEAVNEAVAASKLGTRTAIICGLGQDEAGDIVLNTLKEAGVSTDYVIRSDDHETPVTTMFIAADGSRKSITSRAHRYNCHPEKYTHLFAGARGLILGSLFRSPFDDPEIVYQVISAAKAAGLTVFADTKLLNFRVLGLKDLADSLPLVDYITPNEDEARFYSGKNQPEEMADVFLGYGIKNVIIKLGSQGCLMKNASGIVRLPACHIVPVDATGAGDNFVAGFASEILRGTSPENALAFANACGAICTTAFGAGTALKNRDQVLEFLSRQ